MCSNYRQGGNGKPHQYKLNPVAEPNTSTIENSGALKAATGITDPGKDKDTNHRETITGQEYKGS